MRYFFDAWESVEKKIRRAKNILLCADFDGTIVPLKPRPQDARLSKDFRRLLGRIAKTKPFVVAIISGRALKDIQKKVGLKGLIFAGNHGLEITYKKKSFIHPEAKRHIPRIKRLGRALAKRLSSFSGAILEKKLLSLSLHYRLVKKRKLKALKQIFLQTIKPYLNSQEIKLTYGKKVWEIRPPIAWDKGKAILWLRQRLKTGRMLSIFIGDDSTDEDGFRAVNRIGGISIFVGKKKNSAARYYLKSNKETQKFLTKIQALKNQDAKSKKGKTAL